jgi:3-deoxy-manno-octulosonate cytidylyltransferase (CMP-KDO synthetase)
MQVLGVIPARYASSRFPGKPLADLCGKSMIQRVYEQASQVKNLDKVVVATDDDRILEHVMSFGGEVMMTSEQHNNGTSRCDEVLEILGGKGYSYDVVVNIQGDEPFIQPEQIEKVIVPFYEDNVDITSLATPISENEELFDPNEVKVVMDIKGFALYFSRHALPFQRDIQESNWLKQQDYFKHLGLYAFRADVLRKVVRLAPSALEQAEKLEQLRWLENGFSIKMEITSYQGHGVDTPEDLEKLINNSCE